MADEENKQQEQEAANQESGEKKVNVSAKLEKIIDQIKDLSVLELSELVHALEDVFGVTAAAPMAVAAAPVAGAAADAGEPAEEKTSFNVILASAGANKIAVIKALREVNTTLGLKEAKDLVDAAPKEILSSVNKTTADEAKEKITAAGGTVELR